MNKLWKQIRGRMLSRPQGIISQGDACMSFEDVVIYAESLAEKLTAECYGILCHHEMSAALAALACFAAGKTALMMSYRYGNKLVSSIFDTFSPPCVITDKGGELHTVSIDDGRYASPSEAPACIMCSSGTTGEPKGIMLSEANIISVIESIADYFPADETDRFCICRPLFHSAALTGELLTALWCGSDVHFYSRQIAAEELLREIESHDCTILGATPTIMGMLSRYCMRSSAPPSLKKLIISGESLGTATARYITEAFPEAEKYHVYGLTEASPRVSYLPPELFETHPDCAGYPIKNVKVRIVHPDGKKCCPGEDGELLVKGPNVMMGYFGDPEQTKRVLSGGWLHTGDIACADSTGLLRIKGRKDDMIIRGGVNIYPVEIENRLKKDPRTTAVLVYGKKAEGAYVSGEIAMKIQGSFASVDEVRHMCMDLLDPYLVPTHIELTDNFPRTGSGKIKRKAE